MAFEQSGFRQSYPAGADLSSYQYRFVKVSSGQFVLCGAGDSSFGILQDTPNAAGVAGSALYEGISRIVVDAGTTPIAAMDNLKSDASGRGVKTTTAGDEVGAIALEAATTTGAIIAVRIVHYRY